MRYSWFVAGVAALGCGLAAPAIADDTCEGGMCALPAVCTASAAPSAREIQSAVDAYLAPSKSDASLVGGPGQAGYDGGFWIRGGSFLLKINLTIQTRFEYFDWDESETEPSPGGDLSGFSLPRLTLKLSGDVLCDMHYYAELEFGHHGSWFDNENLDDSDGTDHFFDNWIGPQQSKGFLSADFGIAREAWIEWEAAPAFAIRMGLIKTAATRQLMTPPEMQQFVDISMASAAIGQVMPGYSDRNRDYGIMVHGALGCDGEWQYMATVTNGDGPVKRNVIDGRTDDPLAYSARINWDIKGHMGYEEGALKQRSCDWSAAVGAWVHYYVDHFVENSITHYADRMAYGVDAAFGMGGFSFTAAYNMWDYEENVVASFDEGSSYFAQLGYLFPDSAWEIAARYGGYTTDHTFDFQCGATEWGVAVNYYIDGHANKLTWDATFISGNADDGDINEFGDVYAGYSPTFDTDGMLIRFQWQLAL
jgi:hypothetical protein